MYRNQENVSRFKLAQLWHLVKGTLQTPRDVYLHNSVLNETLKDFDMNYKITIKLKPRQGPKAHFNDCTALHFLSYAAFDIDAFATLLERGADYTIKNGNDQTALHLCVTECLKLYYEVIPFINAVLSAHVKYQNSANPCDSNGISHLHGACIANHVQALELFLENVALIDDAVNYDAPLFSGYTPLHFAVKFGSFEVAQKLIERGANVNAKTAEGWSVLDVLVVKKDERSFTKVQKTKEEQLVKLLLEKGGISNVGLSSLHVALTLQDLSVAERLLNEGADFEYAVPVESPICTGYTALHFAANSSIEAVKMLLERGAKIDLSNTCGLTPLDLCSSQYNLSNVRNILSCEEGWKGISLSDGQIKLLDVIASLESLDQFKSFFENEVKDIEAVVPSDSALWPGYTFLHLAVTFTKDVGHDEETCITECLDCGIDLNAQDIRGRTPIHLAFYQGKPNIVRKLLERLNELSEPENLVDQDNLSYLHIACQVAYEPVLLKLLKNAEPNIAYGGEIIDVGFIEPGSTPLHIATKNSCSGIAELLLRQGANLHASDQNDLTPVHYLLIVPLSNNQIISNVLLGALLKNVEDRVADELRLSYLHVACFFGNVQLVERLLDIGSDVNATIKYDNNLDANLHNFALSQFKAFSNFTPVHMAIQTSNPKEDTLEMLLQRGADVLVNRPNFHNMHHSIAIKNPQVMRCFCTVLRDRDDMQKSMEEKLGLTKLHIACYLKNEEGVRRALNDKVDVNAQICADSNIFAGGTPLHLLFAASTLSSNMCQLETLYDVEAMIKMLVDNGADVTLINAELDTPIHTLFKHRRSFLHTDRCMGLLLNAQNHNANPVNAEGVSHLHIACFSQAFEVVQKFIQCGFIDINLTIDCFAEEYAGSTPLHLLLQRPPVEPTFDWTGLSQTVDLMLKRGANVAAKDLCGDTPLHRAAALISQELFQVLYEKLSSNGGNIYIANLHGQTAIDLWCSNNSRAEWDIKCSKYTTTKSIDATRSLVKDFYQKFFYVKIATLQQVQSLRNS